LDSAGNNPEREESAGKPTNGKAQLPNGKPMTREDIIRMAREARMPYFYGTWEIVNVDGLERFAALVAANERPWVGLTDEELSELSASGLALWELWRAIESKLKEKNT
jgi:hypothetical protein